MRLIALMCSCSIWVILWQILSNEIHFPVLLMGRSLEMLVDVNLAEEGILRLLFAAVYLMLNKSGNDSETSAASR